MTGDLPVPRVTRTADGVAFWIHVTPRSRRDAVRGRHGDALRVTVTAPPVGGEANAACVRALAAALGVRRSRVDLDPGSKGRRKRVRVTGDAEVLAARVQGLAGETALGYNP